MQGRMARPAPNFAQHLGEVLGTLIGMLHRTPAWLGK
jgi:hypothetical protein